MGVDYPWVVERIERWADWALAWSGAWLGYADRAAFVLHAKGRTIESYNSEIAETERAICGLPIEIREVLVERYLRPGLMGEKAKRLHIDRQTFRRRLQWGYRVLAVRFAERKTDPLSSMVNNMPLVNQQVSSC